MAALSFLATTSFTPRIFDALPATACTELAEQLRRVNSQKNGTRWLSAAAQPITPLELAAAAIFARHTAGWSFDPVRSGSEYWVQAHTEVSRSSGLPSNGIHLHRDNDLRQNDLGNPHVHPTFSTITYLTSSPASMSTLIFTDFTQGATVAESTMRELYVVHPAAGKHVVFNGSDWHGVTPPLFFEPGVAHAQSTGRPGAPRVTLLVNIWLGHIPGVQREGGAEAGDDALIAMPPLQLTEVGSDQHEQWAHSEADGYSLYAAGGGDNGGVGSGSGTSSHLAADHADYAGAAAGELALALLMDKSACSGIKIWLPKALVKGGARNTSASVIQYHDGQRLEFESNLCGTMAPRDEHEDAGDGSSSGSSRRSTREEAEADYHQALALRGSDLEGAMRLLARAASSGHAEAQAIMGLAYAQGQGGVEVDMAAATDNLRGAARQEHAEATYNLVALCAARPRCLAASTTNEALTWLREAAKQGLGKAGYEAGHLLLRTGRPDEALASFVDAATGGHAGAMYNAARMLYRRGEKAAAIAWFERATRQTEDTKAAKDATIALDALLGQPVEAQGVDEQDLAAGFRDEL